MLGVGNQLDLNEIPISKKAVSQTQNHILYSIATGSQWLLPWTVQSENVSIEEARATGKSCIGEVYSY